MHFRRLRLLTLIVLVRGTVRVAPIVGCVVLAAKLHAAQHPPLLGPPSDPSPAVTSTEVESTPVRPQPSADALTTETILNEVQMVTPSVGWAWSRDSVRDSVLSRTDDGGRTWTAVGPTGCAHFARGPLRAWVATCDTPGGRIHVTADGGRTWSYTSAATSETRVPISARSLELVGESVGFVDFVFGTEGEEASLYRTSDGGRTWREMGGSPWDATITFVDAEHGWRNTNHTLDRTTDGGVTWTTHPDLVACAVDMVPSFEGRAGVVVGNCPSGVHVFRTVDGGEHWIAGSKVDLTDPGVAVQGGSLAWLWSTGLSLVSTRDGGRTLDTARDAVANGATFQLVAPARGFMAVQVQDDLVVSRTTDGGRTFSPVLTTPYTPTWGLSFADADHGVYFAAFDTGTRILSTSDGGASWRFIR